MTRKRSFLFIIVILIVLLLIGGRLWRQAKSDTMQDSYSHIIPVTGFVLVPQPFTRTIDESGVLSGNKESLIAAETGGRVLKVNVDVGDYVQSGQALVRLDDELYQLESERAKVAFEKAKMDLDRVQKLYDQKSVSESELEGARLAAKGAEVQYRMALKTYNDATVRAPFSGTIAAKLTEVGQMIEHGAPVVQLVDVSTFKLTVSVAENDIHDVSLDAPVNVIVDAVGDTLEGSVSAVGSRAMTGSRTFPVEIKLAGGGLLRSGMFAHAMIAAGTQSAALLLPRAAVLPEAGRSIVFLAKGAAAYKVPIRIIGATGDHLAVEGLSKGDTVITTGNQLLSQGTPIQLTLDGRTTP
jgi:membrane fusion protein, multidrug efflux system